MARITTLFALLFVLILSSCDEGEMKKRMLTSNGKSGEVVVVMPKGMWEGKLGDTVRHTLESYCVGLPQAETRFDIGHYDPSEFTDAVSHHRNLVMFEFEDKYYPAKVEIQNDGYAFNQLLVRVLAQDESEALAIFNKSAKEIARKIDEKERERLIELHMEKGAPTAAKTIDDKYNIQLSLPEGSSISEDRGNFLWIQRDRMKYVNGTAHDVDQGIFIYFYPYTNDSTFTLEYLLKVRDSVCKQNVPGPIDGSYMSTERDPSFYPVAEEISLNGKYAMVIRGLFRTENYYYGGPFISISTYDEARQRIVTIDCYTHAPKFSKREYIRELEAVCYSLSFPAAK